MTMVEIINRVERLPDSLRRRVIGSIEKEIMTAEQEAVSTPSETGLPGIAATERNRILDSLPPLEKTEDPEKWIRIIHETRHDKDTAPSL